MAQPLLDPLYLEPLLVRIPLLCSCLWGLPSYPLPLQWETCALDSRFCLEEAHVVSRKSSCILNFCFPANKVGVLVSVVLIPVSISHLVLNSEREGNECDHLTLANLTNDRIADLSLPTLGLLVFRIIFAEVWLG